jgi:sugar phosphate isomerase/epimerase
MHSGHSRRQFLAYSTMNAARAAAGAAVAATAGPLSAAPRSSKLSVTCRDIHLRLAGKTDCWAAMAHFGVDGVEATIDERLRLPGLFHPTKKYSLATEADAAALREDLQKAGKKITGLCMYNQYDARPDFEIEWNVRAASAAKAAGAPAIRIDVVPHKSSGDNFLPVAVDVLGKIMRATESTGVAFAIENHGSVTNRPEFLAELFDRVGSKRLGLTLDTANFYWFGHPLSKLYTIFEQFADRVFHTHCKNIHYPAAEREKQRPIGWKYTDYDCPVYAGDIDFRRIAGILKKAGYANDLCVEDESLGKFPAEQRPEILAKEVRYLRSLA